MKTIDDLLNHPDNQVDIAIISDYQEGLKKPIEDWEYGSHYRSRIEKIKI